MFGPARILDQSIDYRGPARNTQWQSAPALDSPFMRAERVPPGNKNKNLKTDVLKILQALDHPCPDGSRLVFNYVAPNALFARDFQQSRPINLSFSKRPSVFFFEVPGVVTDYILTNVLQ